jgi:RNA polymerase sigma-70 factor (ECF subfamily)
MTGKVWARPEPFVTNDHLSTLIEAVARDRDRQAFAQLFRHFAPRLKAFGMRRGSDPASAEELAQETMLTVWRKAATFDRRRATASTWIFTIVRNKRIDLFRREGRPEVDLESIVDMPSDTISADDTLTSNQAGQAIRRALDGLPAEQLLIVQKAFFEDKSHSVIAEELNLPLGTVKSRVRLALARLRVALPEHSL